MDSITSDQRRQYNRFTADGARKALTAVNPDKDGLQRLFGRGDEWQEYLTDGVRRFTAKAPDYSLARSILGKDFISPEEIMKSRKGIAYTDEQLATFGDTLPSEEVMEWCRDNGYMLVAGPNRPMSLLEVRDLRNDYFYSKQGGWYAESHQAFSRSDKVETRWLMLRKGPVPESTSKNWNEQQTLLSDEETVPNAAEVAWCVTTYKAVRKAFLLPDVYVRTSSIDSDGDRVHVGGFGADGLLVGGWWGDLRSSDLGVSSSRK